MYDFDVKNNLDNLLSACRFIDKENYKSGNVERLELAVLYAVLEFIEQISINNGEERQADFKMSYLMEYSIDDILEHRSNESLETFEKLRKIDKQNSSKRVRSLSYLYYQLVYCLGKYYCRNRFDKNDIDINRFKSYLKNLTLHSEEVTNKFAPISPSEQEKSEFVKHDETLPEVSNGKNSMDELEALIGLEIVKKEVKSLINLIRINQLRHENSSKQFKISNHLVFSGNPGTGKTTVARILARIYREIGLLSKGQLVEVSRKDLVAGYVGQTALKTQEKIDEAMGGVLFIDEAYTLIGGGNDFGQEAIDTLLKAMEDYREDFIVVVAGYPELMEKFLLSNPGLKSRFSKELVFEDYTAEELVSIFESYCLEYDFNYGETVVQSIKTYFSSLVSNKEDNFANAREVRKVFELTIQNQANRLAKKDDIDSTELYELLVEDLAINI